MTTLPRMLAEQAARHRCFEYVELVDALPKTPKEKVQKYRLRTRGVEGVWDREAAGDRLTR
jgi:carnitine-CoA ligase